MIVTMAANTNWLNWLNVIAAQLIIIIIIAHCLLDFYSTLSIPFSYKHTHAHAGPPFIIVSKIYWIPLSIL